MAGRTVSAHSEEWWATKAPPTALRCKAHYRNGQPCRRQAVDGAVVCDKHGGAIPNVLRRAAQRVQMTADEAAQQLVAWMNDPNVDMRERVKIAHDLMDRSGLGAAQVHKIMPIEEDPLEKLFKGLLSNPDAFETAAPEPVGALPARTLTLEELDRAMDIVDAELVEDEPEPARMLQAADTPAPKRNPTRPPRHILEGLDLL